MTFNVRTHLLTAIAALTVSLSASAQPRSPPAADPVTGCAVTDASFATELAGLQASMLDPDARPDFAAFANTPALKALQEQEAVRRMDLRQIGAFVVVAEARGDDRPHRRARRAS